MKEVLIKTERLCKTFMTGKEGTHVLRNIDMEIYQGDFTVIMGSSGSGKSTLLYSLSTMDKPSSGVVNLLGNDTGKMKEKDTSLVRKREISFIFQSMNLLPDLSAYENITYCGYGAGKYSKKEVNEKAKELMKRFDLWEAKDKFPSELSGGQKQRVAVARAMITEPKVIFGDEPTGALNSSSGKRVLDLLTDINREGQSIVMVTHDLKAARRASRLLYLEDGKIAGELCLGAYVEEDKENRDAVIYDFLKNQGW